MARQFLLAEQRDDGSWVGHCPSDASLPSHLIFLLAFQERETTDLAHQAAATIFKQQQHTGCWSLTCDGPADVSTSVQAYLALKLVGTDPGDSRLARARNIIRQLGGADAVDSTTRFILALFGQLSYEHCEPLPPELLLFSRRGWRDLAPFMLIWSHRPTREFEAERGIRELFIKRPCDWQTPPSLLQTSKVHAKLRTLSSVGWRFAERHGWTPLRERALDLTESQLLGQSSAERIGSLNLHDLAWHAIALQTAGYADDSAEMQHCQERLQEMLRINQAANHAMPGLRTSGFSDTATVIQTLLASGIPTRHRAITDATTWLAQSLNADKKLDAAALCPVLAAQFETTQFDGAAADLLPPDIGFSFDDFESTIDATNNEYLTEVGIDQLIKHQNRDGGWSVDDARECKSRRSSPDVTGSVLVSIRSLTTPHVVAARERAVAYLRSSQNADGSWDSATGAQLIHGTALAIRGLLAAGIPVDDDAVATGLNWLLVHQQPSGGWGEAATAAGSEFRGQGSGCESAPVQLSKSNGFTSRSTVSQTAWALLALVAAGRASHSACRRAVEFLLENQDDDGGWQNPQSVFRDVASKRWFGNDLQTVAGPLLALSRWIVASGSTQSEATNEMSLRLVMAGADD